MRKQAILCWLILIKKPPETKQALEELKDRELKELS
jgi:hypothetical protein